MNNLLLGRLSLQAYITYPLVRELTDKEGDYLSDAQAIGQYTVGTILIWIPKWKPIAVGAGVRWGAGVALSATTIAAPFLAGYAIGAAVGTTASSKLFGDEGAQTALGFYSLGLLPGTEAPTLGTYGNLLRPSETSTPGPIDLISQGVMAVKTKLRKIQIKTPSLISPNFGPRYS